MQRNGGFKMSEMEWQHYNMRCVICRRLVYYGKAFVCHKHKRDIIIEFLKEKLRTCWYLPHHYADMEIQKWINELEEGK